MDSLRQHRSNYDPLFFRPMYSETRRRRGSTSQMCLHKILSIITTVPPPLAEAIPPFSALEVKESSAEDDTSNENKGSGFDLNVVDGFCITPELKESFEGDASRLSSSSTNGLEESGSAVHGSDRVENEEHGVGVSENSHIKIEEAEKSLALLIEAAKVIFGEFTDADESESGKRNVSTGSELKKDEAEDTKLGRRASCWTSAEVGEDFEEPPSSPVVRSKRGRTQVLPCKYRDSVLEPLTRFSRTRSSILPSKRRRR